MIHFPDVRIPERKPVVARMWYDEDGRLWVFLWPAEADSMYRAHVYDADGVFLHEAEWPRGIAIWYGGLSGDVAARRADRWNSMSSRWSGSDSGPGPPRTHPAAP